MINRHFIQLFLLGMIISLAGVERLDAGDDPRMNRMDVTHYTLGIEFDITRKEFTGSVGVTGRAREETSELVLSASQETLVIDSVLLGSVAVSFSHEASHIVVPLPGVIVKDEGFELTVFYHGQAKYRGQYDGGGVLINIVRGLGRIATISEPSFARTWWPCKDVPNDKATATIRVTVPRTLTAVSNGLLTKTETTKEKATYTWETKYPTATYLIAIAAAKYRRFSDTYVGLNGQSMKVWYYVFPEEYAKARTDFARTIDMIRYLAITFCEYPFLDEKFAFVEVSGSMTMENQTVCTIQDYLITGDRQFESTLFHELAHHWWGNLITTDTWIHTWLNEGFATYAEALYAEHLSGRDGYHRFMNNLMAQPPGRYAGSVIGRSDSIFWDSFSDRVYNKGAIVLHMLRGVVGDSTFFTIMRAYLNSPDLRYANARTEDFIRICERYYGRRLDWFFNQWLYSRSEAADRPVYSTSWTSSPAQGSHTVRLTLKQSGTPADVYTMPFVVAIHTPAGVSRFSIVDSLRDQSFDFIVKDPPQRLDIDPDNWVFKAIQEARGNH